MHIPEWFYAEPDWDAVDLEFINDPEAERELAFELLKSYRPVPYLRVISAVQFCIVAALLTLTLIGTISRDLGVSGIAITLLLGFCFTIHDEVTRTRRIRKLAKGNETILHRIELAIEKSKKRRKRHGV